MPNIYKFKRIKTKHSVVITGDGRIRKFHNSICFNERKVPVKEVMNEVRKYRANENYVEIEV